MSDLFQVNGEGFIEILGKKSIAQNDAITLLDIFEAYVEMAEQSSDACDPNMLRSLIFKQFSKYGDFDKEVQKTAQAVSNIVTTTSEVITAIEKDDKDNLQKSYDKLKSHEQEITAVQDSMIKDEYTGLYNRKYFFTQVLDSEMTYTQHGFLFDISIYDIGSIEYSYGSIVKKSILKKFAQMLQKSLAETEQSLILYDDNEFLIFSDQKHADEVRNVLKLLHRTLEVKKFKITDSKHISFNFEHNERPVKTAEAFDSPF